MCSVFRRRIASQMITVLRPFLEGSDKPFFYDVLPLHIKLNQPKSSPPSFEIAWKDIVKLKPDLKERVHPSSMLTYLKNQDFPTVDGFSDIDMKNEKHEKFIFTADQQVFTSSVLLDIAARIESIPSRSTFFKNIPPEITVIDFSSPNIAKPFHYGHFRSTIMGNFLANICQYVGHDVTRINYIGDWGLQYGILALGFSQFSCESKLADDPLGHLFEVYRDSNAKSEEDPKFKELAHNYFRKMEEGDSEALKLWNKLKEISFKKMEETYLRLNIKFDEVHSESMYVEKSKEVLNLLLQDGLAHKNEDGSIQRCSEDKEETVILMKSDGTSLYLSRDLAAAIDRHKKYHFDSMYYVVDSAQTKHFQHLKNILKSMGFAWENNIHHIPFGRILNFSTRKGNVVFLHDILNEAKERTIEKMKKSPNTKVTENFDEVADILGISSLIINDFSCRRKREISFNWDKVLSMTEDSGTSLQYCHARICSIKEKSGLEVTSNWDLTSLTEPESISLIAHLSKYDEVIYHTYTTMEPCVLVHYLFTLRCELGRAIKALQVIGSSPNTARKCDKPYRIQYNVFESIIYTWGSSLARLLLFHCAELILKKSFQLLGITPLSKM